MERSAKARKIVILGAGGRDFHLFNTLYRSDPDIEVVAFTAAQIPFQEGRRYPPVLSGSLYPRGIPIVSEKSLSDLFGRKEIDEVVLAYSDISHQKVMEKASLALFLGADFRIVSFASTFLEAKIPVISVCAVRTGCGKSPVTRYLARHLRQIGKSPVVVRHPMAYGSLETKVAQAFVDLSDLERFNCTIEEREEYEPLLEMGVPLFAGVDYGRVLEMAQTAGDLLLWDGGNNDLSFIHPGLEIVLADPWRGGDEASYFPSLINLRRADIIVISKSDDAPADGLNLLKENIHRCNSLASVVQGVLELGMSDASLVRGARVVVVEDGPTLTHGGMTFGAGIVAARRYGAAKVVDPRPYAQGSLVETYKEFPRLNQVIPAMGYSEAQIDHLRQTIESVPCDVVLAATPVDLKKILKLDRPVVRVSYEFTESNGTPLKDAVDAFLRRVEKAP